MTRKRYIKRVYFPASSATDVFKDTAYIKYVCVGGILNIFMP